MLIRFLNRHLWRKLMSVESKLNALLAAQAAQNAILATIAAETEAASTSTGSAAIATLQNSVTALQTELGNDTDGQAGNPAPAPASTPPL